MTAGPDPAYTGALAPVALDAVTGAVPLSPELPDP